MRENPNPVTNILAHLCTNITRILRLHKSINILSLIFEPGHYNLCVFLKTQESGF